MSPETNSNNESNQTEKEWRLWREDIYGNQYQMPLNFDTEEQAIDAHKEYTDKGHHQTYSVRLTSPDDPIFIPAHDA